MQDINQVIGANLRRLRLAKNLSGEQLGKGIKPPVSYQQIQKYEKGKNRISCATLYDIAQILNCSVLEFYSGVESATGITLTTLRKSKTNGLEEKIEMLSPSARSVVAGIVRALTDKMSMNHE